MGNGGHIDEGEVTLVGDEHSSTARQPSPAQLSQGTVIGRYVVASRIGIGGMGLVYAAYDPELDRRVALKLLLTDLDELRAQRWRARLLREAQALARLQHPNVVTIHDVGTHDERVWLAMELVEGRTLGGWIAAEHPTWSEVIDVLVHAGRGVAAAHAANLLHRDLKPDNIMVGVDGRVRVMDFGLARPRHDHVGSASFDASQSQTKLDALSLEVTQIGALIGTPGYMAPEQLRGQQIGPAADQFSFCVMAWEALFGERPFSGRTVPELTVAALEGTLRMPSERTTVPKWVRHVLERGLAVDQDQRWPSMEALLHALGQGRARARSRRRLMIAGALGATVLCAAAWHRVDRHRQQLACEEQAASMADVWNPTVREAVGDAFVTTELSYAEETAAKVMPWIEAYAMQWQSARLETCLEREVHRDWDDDLVDRAHWCLEERRLELEALLTELSRGDPQAVQTAVAAAAALRPIERCRDATVLRRLPRIPVEQREEITELRGVLAKAAALQGVERVDEARRSTEDVLVRVRAIGWPPLLAEATLTLGGVLRKAGDYEKAAETLEAAYFESVTAELWPTAIDAAEFLASVEYERGQYEEARRWLRHARALAEVAPEPSGRRTTHQMLELAAILHATGAYEETKQLAEQALAQQEEILGVAHPEVVHTLNLLATNFRAMGQYDAAKSLYERVLALLDESVASDHPDVAMALNNLAVLHRHGGDLE